MPKRKAYKQISERLSMVPGTRKTDSPTQSTVEAQYPAFRFLELPAELRNSVYDYLFEDSTTTVGPLPSSKGRWWYFEHKHSTQASAVYGFPPILTTNKQIRNEAISIFYTRTTWAATSHGDLAALLKKLGPERVAAPVEKTERRTAAPVTKIRYVIVHDFRILRIAGLKPEASTETLREMERFAWRCLRYVVAGLHGLHVCWDVLGVEVEGVDGRTLWDGEEDGWRDRRVNEEVA